MSEGYRLTVLANGMLRKMSGP